MRKLSLSKTTRIVLGFCAMSAIASSAQTFTTLISFDGVDGGRPTAGLVQGTDGNFYGTTSNFANDDCTNGCGTVFKITDEGTLTTLHSFNGTDGGQPIGGLVQGTDGNFYGTTEEGGDPVCPDSLGCGTVFKITAGGTLTTLHKFHGSDGFFPYTSLIEGADGSFYGTTSYAGSSNGGTVFKITPAGTFTTLYTFVCTSNGCPEGDSPSAALVQGKEGDFFGTTYLGGKCCGTVFKLTPSGKLITLHRFDGTDGGLPEGALVQGKDGSFYGTTRVGGDSRNQECSTGPVNGCGTVFKVTPAGELTMLYSFCSLPHCDDGAGPEAGLTLATDGNFYGTTGIGNGTVFRITPAGSLTTLHSFDNTDGSQPVGTLLQSTNGDFYGTAYEGGTYIDGTVFSLSVGLPRFVETRPTSGSVGAAIIILGNNLTAATSVTFNGAAATFYVVSHSQIIATVPAGASTGVVEVMTPEKTLKSNVVFHVRP